MLVVGSGTTVRREKGNQNFDEEYTVLGIGEIRSQNSGEESVI
jgi:hypothetical protein